MATQKQGFLLRFVPGVVLCLLEVFLTVFDVLALPARITMLIIGIALVATSAVPWRAKKP